MSSAEAVPGSPFEPCLRAIPGKSRASLILGVLLAGRRRPAMHPSHRRA